MFLQNFIELSAAVHELSCSQREKTRLQTILPSVPRAVTKLNPVSHNNNSMGKQTAFHTQTWHIVRC